MAQVGFFHQLDPRIFALAFVRMVVTAGFSMVMPFLAIHLTVERGVPAFTVGAIWASSGLLSALAQWASGALSDRYGRKPLMLVSLLIRAANLAGMGLAVKLEAPIIVIAALTVGNGILRAFFDPCAGALVADLVPVERRVAAFSVQRVGINIGWAAGPAIASFASTVPYSTLFFASVPTTLAALFLVSRIAEPCVGARKRLSHADLLAFRGDGAFVGFLVATVFFFILQVQLYQSISIYAARHLHLNRSEVGHIYTLNGILVVFLQVPAVRFINAIGTRVALLMGCLLYALAYAAIGTLAVGYTSLLVCIAGVTLAEIISAPAQQTTVTAMAPTDFVGAYTGLFGLAQVLGQSSGPLIGTAFLDHLPTHVAWPALALFGVAAALGYRHVSREITSSGTPQKPLARVGKA